jgi:hypothetical protein
MFADCWSVARYGVSLLAILAIVAGLLLTIYRLTVLRPEVIAIDQRIRQEFQTIQPVPGSTVVNTYSSRIWRRVAVGASYAVNATEQEIANNYRSQLTSSGWTYVRRDKSLYYGRDYGGWVDTYCFQDQQAHVDYAGQQASFGWTYGFEISWEPSSVCR